MWHLCINCFKERWSFMHLYSLSSLLHHLLELRERNYSLHLVLIPPNVGLCELVFVFLWPHLWHMEVPRPGIKPEPQHKQHWILHPQNHHGAATWARLLQETKQGYFGWQSPAGRKLHLGFSGSQCSIVIRWGFALLASFHSNETEMFSEITFLSLQIWKPCSWCLCQGFSFAHRSLKLSFPTTQIHRNSSM